MIEDVISNDCNISDTFINSANITPNNIYLYIDKQIDRYRYIYATILNYIILSYHNILSKYQCGFKGHNSQHRLITITKKFRKRVNKGDAFRVLLTDLSNALSHELLIAKLHLYGFDMKYAIPIRLPIQEKSKGYI